VEKISLLTQGKNTNIIAGKLDFSKYDAVYLKVSRQFTQFIEPFIDTLVSKGIYCQFKPEAFYIIANKPYQYAVLNAKGINVSESMIFSDASALEWTAEEIKFPVIFKTFLGLRKTQSLVVENMRSFKSLVKSIRGEVDAITLQEYFEGDVNYAAVIGKDVYTIKRKWNAQKFEHEKKPVSATLSDEDAKMAIKAAQTVGTDLATVKLVEGKVIGVRPTINFLQYKKVMGKDLGQTVAKFYKERVG
jgi:glutathione synthase/RimK-type ligase-like ATP-grasp enzyme